MEDSNNQPAEKPAPEQAPQTPEQAPPAPETPTGAPEPPIIVPDISEIAYKAPRNPRMARVVAGGIIAVVMIIALAVALKALNSGQKSINISQAESSTDNTEKTETYLTENEKQTLIKNVLNLVKTAIASVKDQNPDLKYEIQDIYDTDSPYYRPATAKAAMPLEKSFGIRVSAEGDSSELVQMMIGKAKIELSDIGFTEYRDVVQTVGGDYGYIDKDNRILCSYLPSDLQAITTFQLSCGHLSWVSTEKIALSNSLAEAYKDKMGEYPGILVADSSKIENSPYTPYQRLEASLGNAIGLFYRAGTSADWVFFKATQAVLPCSDYKEDVGARHAFQGETCFDEKTGENTKIKERN